MTVDCLQVIHDCRFVSDLLYHQYGIILNSVFDTQVSALVLIPLRYWRPFVTSAPLSSMPVHAEPLRMRTNVVKNFRVIRRLYRREWNWLCVNQHPLQRTRGRGEWRHTPTAYYKEITFCHVFLHFSLPNLMDMIPFAECCQIDISNNRYIASCVAYALICSCFLWIYKINPNPKSENLWKL